MLPYLIAGAIGFGIAKIFEEGGETFARGGTTNEDILRSFLTSNRETQTNNLSTHYNQYDDFLLLRNYSTLIAIRKGNDVRITNIKYSNTTSTITNRLKALAEEMGYNVSYVSKFENGGEMFMAGGKAGGRDLGDAKIRLNELDSDGNTSVEYDEENDEWYWEDYSNDSYRGGFSSELEAYNDLIDYLENNSDEDKYAGGGHLRKFKAIRNEDADEIGSNGKKRYAVEFASLMEDGEIGNYGEEWEYYDTEKEAENRIKEFNKKGYFTDEYAEGGEVDILKLYLKDTFSEKDSELIDEAIENGDIDTDTIKEDCMDYIYDRLEKEFGDKYSSEEIWEYTDENLSNGLTHKENYQNLVEYLKDDEYAGGGRVTKFVRVFFVQGNYGQGWEDLTAHDDMREAKKEKRVYDENESYPHRVIERRVLRSDYEKGNYATGGEAKKRRRRANAQTGSTDRSVDKTRVAKPVGYRFTNSLASKLRKDKYAVPTEKQITKYLGKGIYKENRRNQSDRDKTAKL